MRFDIMICPDCGETAWGTCDFVPACAIFTEPDETGNVDYSGNTQCFYNGQVNKAETAEWESTQAADPRGITVLQCENGHEWAAHRLD